MLAVQSSAFLRRVLLVDAIASGGMGLMLLLFVVPAAALLNLPSELLSQAGLVLLPFAAFVGYLSSREVPSRVAVWAVIALNAVWVIDSVVLLVAGWVQPNARGYAFIVGQALFVAVLAELEYMGLRRSLATAA